MNHRDFLKSLSIEDRLRLNAKSDAAGLAHLALHWGAILLVGTLIAARVPGWPFLMVVQGILMVFLFTLLHETSHLTPFETRSLNTAVGYVCGVLILLPANWFRYFHFAHHRYTQDPEKDPELVEPKPETWAQYIWHVSGFPVWFAQVRTILRNAGGHCDDAFVPAARLKTVQTEARVMLALYGVLAVLGVAFGLTGILFVWIVPLLLGQPFLRLYLLAEHGRCPLVADMFENTRTTFTNRIVRALAWNMPYHAEHHALPTVPFHRLPELHRLTREHLKETENGYAHFHGKYVAGFTR